jgi:hypothetical protein
MDCCRTCGAPLHQSGRGRPTEYCGVPCRRAAERAKATTIAFYAHDEPVLEPLNAPERPTAGDTDTQVAQCIIEASAVAGAFMRLGREARPAFAWRCEKAGLAITAAIRENFGEVA